MPVEARFFNAMKVLILSKSFEREIRYLVEHITEHYPQIQIHAIMPSMSATGILSGSLSCHRLNWPNHMRAAWFSPARLPEFATFRPDIVQIFEEYSSLMAFQAVLLRNIYCPQSKIMAYAAENIPGNVRSIFRLTSRYVMHHADLAFVCSHGVKDVLAAEGFTAPIEVFPLGVNTNVFRKCDASQLKRDLGLDGKFVIGYVGRLLAIKGIFDLLDVLRELPDSVHLLLIGSGPEEREVRRQCVVYGVTDRVHVRGEVLYSDLPQYMNCLDVGIVPSHTTPRWKEQFGRVLVELMGCEVPVIGSDSGSIPEVLGEAGLIFPERRVDALARLVRHLLDQPEHRRELGQRGRARVDRLYALSIMYRQLFAMYERVGGAVVS